MQMIEQKGHLLFPKPLTAIKKSSASRDELHWTSPRLPPLYQRQLRREIACSLLGMKDQSVERVCVSHRVSCGNHPVPITSFHLQKSVHITTISVDDWLEGGHEWVCIDCCVLTLGAPTSRRPSDMSAPSGAYEAVGRCEWIPTIQVQTFSYLEATNKA